MNSIISDLSIPKAGSLAEISQSRNLLSELIQKDLSRLGMSNQNQIIPKVEYQPDSIQVNPFRALTQTSQQIRSHLDNLESAFVKIEAESRNSNQFRNTQSLNNHSLSEIPSFQNTPNMFGFGNGKSCSMILENMTNPYALPQPSSSQVNRNPTLNMGSHFATQTMRSAEPAQARMNQMMGQNFMNSEFAPFQERRGQMNCINLFQGINNNGNRQQLQIQPQIPLNSMYDPRFNTQIRKNYESSQNMAPHLVNQVPLDANLGNAKQYIPQSLDKILAGAPLLNDFVSKIGIYGSLSSYHEMNMSKSTALTESSSPKHTKLISFNSPNGTFPSLQEIPEPENIEQNPSMTSLDDDIRDEVQKHHLRSFNPIHSNNGHFDTVINIDNEDTLSKNSYASITKKMKSFSLPEINPDFRVKIEERNDQRVNRNEMNKVPGIYSKEVRGLKILKYKNKIVKWRINHPVNRAFSGRSVVAGAKPRIKGKFVSNEEYQRFLEKTKNRTDLPFIYSKQLSDIKIEECS